MKTNLSKYLCWVSAIIPMCVMLPSCEFMTGDSATYFLTGKLTIDSETPWQKHPNAPIEWRILKGSSTVAADRRQSVEFKNVGSQKIRIVGLVTRNPRASFIDLHQPGAFDATLYPGAFWSVDPDGDNQTDDPNGIVYFHVQDYIVAN